MAKEKYWCVLVDGAQEIFGIDGPWEQATSLETSARYRLDLFALEQEKLERHLAPSTCRTYENLEKVRRHWSQEKGYREVPISQIVGETYEAMTALLPVAAHKPKAPDQP